ncbi:MAG: Iron-sulfur cluster carrier protein [Chlamydiales bacterium]|nr:Iron-sulfur cluster carrier protein [Chlamydiales bacterium]MCH9635529.1 Iron-sulfur cluster carrier protein [Chlamydiales bacterium]MCH9703738.1 Mrp/NBP35 family ATP-binding protein [Chlamydiota bacterium]
MLPLFKTRRIAVAAGKGGVGKTTCAIALALALQKSASSALLDGDLYGPSVGKMLQMDHLPTEKEGVVLPGEVDGLKVMSLAFFDQPNFVVRAPIANRVLDQFLNKIYWGDVEYMIYDFPPGTGDIPITLAKDLDGAILVTTPQEVALFDVARCHRFFEKLQVPILGVVENMTGEFFGRGAGRRFAFQAGVDFLGEVEMSKEISQKQDSSEAALLRIPLFEEIANRLQLLPK